MNYKCETFNAAVNIEGSQEINRANMEQGKQEYPEGNAFTGLLEEKLYMFALDQKHYT